MFSFIIMATTTTKSAILLFTLIFFSLSVHSQEAGINFGPKIGANFSNLDTNNVSASQNSITGLTAGLFLEIRSSSAFSFQAELLYSEQGADLDSNINQLQNVELEYLQAPILLKYRLLKIFNVHAGPQLGFLTNDIKSDNYESENFDFSGVAGVGAEIGKLRADLRYHFGFTDAIEINSLNNSSNARNKYYSITLSYELF